MPGWLRGIQAIAACFFGLAAFSAIELAVRFPAEGRSAAWYAVHGLAFLDPGNFAPGGAAAHDRFLVGAAGFGATVVVGLVGVGLSVRAPAPPP